jgi:hypothetical protein
MLGSGEYEKCAVAPPESALTLVNAHASTIVAASAIPFGTSITPRLAFVETLSFSEHPSAL